MRKLTDKDEYTVKVAHQSLTKLVGRLKDKSSKNHLYPQ